MTDNDYSHLKNILPSLDNLIKSYMEGAKVSSFHVETISKNKGEGDLFLSAFELCIMSPDVFGKFCLFMKETYPNLIERSNNDGEDDGN